MSLVCAVCDFSPLLVNEILLLSPENTLHNTVGFTQAHRNYIQCTIDILAPWPAASMQISKLCLNALTCMLLHRHVCGGQYLCVN